MEDSRKDRRNGEKGLSTHIPHMDEGNGKKAILYNTKEETEKGGEKRKDKERSIHKS